MLKLESLRVGNQYTHGPLPQSELPVLTLIYIGKKMVVLEDDQNQEQTLDLNFFIEYAREYSPSKRTRW